MIELILLFVFIAVFAEAVWDNITTLLPAELPPWADRAGVMVLAVFFCVTTGADLFETFGLYLPWSSGAFFTGILCSRGANYIHDLASNLNKEGAQS